MGSTMASPTGDADGLATASDDAGDADSSGGWATEADGTSATALGAGLGAPPDPPAFRPAPTTTTHQRDDADDGGRDQPRRPPALGTHGMGPVSRRHVLLTRVEVRVADAHRGSVQDAWKKAAPRPGGRTGRERKQGWMADPTGFEPAISSVTGWHVGPLHHGSAAGGG